jgi:hypothetical protein
MDYQQAQVAAHAQAQAAAHAQAAAQAQSQQAQQAQQAQAQQAQLAGYGNPENAAYMVMIYKFPAIAPASQMSIVYAVSEILIFFWAIFFVSSSCSCLFGGCSNEQQQVAQQGMYAQAMAGQMMMYPHMVGFFEIGFLVTELMLIHRCPLIIFCQECPCRYQRRCWRRSLFMSTQNSTIV